MEIGVRCGPLKLKNDFPALVRWLGENGFDSVDLMAADAEQKAAAEAAGLSIGTFDLPGAEQLLNPDDDARAQAVKDMKSKLTAAAELGLKTWFTCVVPVDRQRSRGENFELWKTSWPQVTDHCESLGIAIAMEPWPGGPPHYANLGCTPEMWRAMFEVVPSPALGLCFDPSHLVRLGIDYLRAIHEFGDRVHHVHAKDTEIFPEQQYLQGRLTPSFGRPTFACSEGWWRYCIPGDGEVDWRALVVRLIAAGYDGPLSIELEDGVYMTDEDGNRRGLIAAREHLRSVIR